ncbi:hypothetical protein SRRS_50410 [Sporomusa rhizae]|uniref:dimethyl sulfoxide reductase anchor subunit family protein n=1 Tax=Sporomusa rhizae TaxID=357999 RepID=UPI00352ADC96
MNYWEFPLVLFTVFGQWAVGIVVTIAVLEYSCPYLLQGDSIKGLRIAGCSVFPLMALAQIVSLFHLGNPLGAYNAMLNIGTSSLSLEILSFGMFSGLSLIYSGLWWKMPEQLAARKLIGIVATIIGFGAILASASVYLLPAHQTWNSWQTISAFVTSAALLGPLTIITALSYSSRELKEWRKLNKNFGFWLLLALGVIAITLIAFVKGYGNTFEQTRAIANTITSSLFGFHLFASMLLPAVVALSLISRPLNLSSRFMMTIMIFAVLGEMSGRALFYYAVMSQQPWF